MNIEYCDVVGVMLMCCMDNQRIYLYLYIYVL